MFIVYCNIILKVNCNIILKVKISIILKQTLFKYNYDLSRSRGQVLMAGVLTTRGRGFNPPA